jgi:hypothetical protein
MIGPHVTLEDLDVVRLADLADEIAETLADKPSQNRLAVLRDEDEVVVALVDRVRTVTILLHSPEVPQPPEGVA